ncbi:MAG: pectin acetylesterase-family hydrolase [Myxococcota bacterium]
MKTTSLMWTIAMVGGVVLVGCSDDSTSDGGTGGSGGSGSNAVFQELYDQGLTRYVGEFSPSNDPAPDDQGVRHYEFAVPDDLSTGPRVPVCIRGGQWTMDTREGASDNLVIFLQGGGACWPEFCSAAENAGPLAAAGILDPDLAGNPLADWNVSYLPYCDGSLFAGDVDRDLPGSIIGEGGGGQGYQRGLQNLTSALDVTAAQFPNPPRIVLTGVSGGAFGTIVALPLVRFYYPDAEILVFNDSGIGVAKGEDDPDFVNDTLLAGWNADGLIPESCPDCTSNGHVTRFVEWQLETDPNVTMSAMSFSADFVIATTFLMIPATDFTTELLAETGRITDNFPDRYRRFIAEGAAHTTLLRAEPGDPVLGGLEIGSLETAIDGTSVLDWFSAYVDGTDDWQNLVEDGVE